MFIKTITAISLGTRKLN